MKQERNEIIFNSKKGSRLKRKGMLITVFLCLLCLFPNISLGRETEIPENLIEEKVSSITEQNLGAVDEERTIELDGAYDANSGAIKLTWTTNGDYKKYNVFMKKRLDNRSFTEDSYITDNRYKEHKIKETNSKSYIVPNPVNVDGLKISIKDEIGPRPPVITTSILENGKGFNVKVNAVGDQGTVYRFRVEGRFTRIDDSSDNSVLITTPVVSNEKQITITSGLKEYQYLLTKSANSTFSGYKKATTISDLNTAINRDVKTNFDANWSVQYLYVRAVDKAGNAGGIVMKRLENSLYLTSTYDKNSNSVTLRWTLNTNTPGQIVISLYKNKTTIATINNASKKGSRKVSGADTAKPNAPTLTSTKNSDYSGYTVKVKDNGDNGTKYEFSADALIKTAKGKQLDAIFLIDLSGSMVDVIDAFTKKQGGIYQVAKDIIDDGGRVATIRMDGLGNPMEVSDGFTRNINQVAADISAWKTGGHKFAEGLNEAINMFKNDGESDFKAIILFSDSNSDYLYENYLTKVNTMLKMQRNSINLYAIYRTNSMAIVKPYTKDARTLENPEESDTENIIKDIRHKFREMYAIIKEDLKIPSNVATIEAKSGTIGYEYYISKKQLSSSEQLTKLNRQGTTVSGFTSTIHVNAQEYDQYVYVRIKDKAGNDSAIKEIKIPKVEIQIKLKSNYKNGLNYVPLSWTNTDKREGYLYELYRREEDGAYIKVNETSNSTRTLKSSSNKSTSFNDPGKHTFIVPDGVTSITATMVGAGGGGSGNYEKTGTGESAETQTLSYKEPGTYTWPVPAGVTSITATIAGAGGGGSGNYEGTTGSNKVEVVSNGTRVIGASWNGEHAGLSMSDLPEYATLEEAKAYLDSRWHGIINYTEGTWQSDETGEEYQAIISDWFNVDLDDFGGMIVYTEEEGWTPIAGGTAMDIEPGLYYLDVSYNTPGTRVQSSLIVSDGKVYSTTKPYNTTDIIWQGGDESASYRGLPNNITQTTANKIISKLNGVTANGHEGNINIDGFTVFYELSNDEPISLLYNGSIWTETTGYWSVQEGTPVYNAGATMATNTTKPGRTGGSGALRTETIAVVPGENIQIVVGTGGIAGITNGDGGNGESSSVRGTTAQGVSAQGGQGGIAPTETSSGKNGTSYGNGAAGGSAGTAGLNGYVDIEYVVYEEKTEDFTIPGTHEWIVPNGVTSITAEIAGAGGGGSGSYGTSGSGGNSGSGGTETTTKTVTTTVVGEHILTGSTASYAGSYIEIRNLPNNITQSMANEILNLISLGSNYPNLSVETTNRIINVSNIFDNFNSTYGTNIIFRYWSRAEGLEEAVQYYGPDPYNEFSDKLTYTNSKWGLNGNSAWGQNYTTNLINYVVQQGEDTTVTMPVEVPSGSFTLNEGTLNKTFTVPSGITVLKVHVGMAWVDFADCDLQSDTKEWYNYVQQWGVSGEIDDVVYVGVTPGETYNLYATVATSGNRRWEIEISYSPEINNHAVDVEDYKGEGGNITKPGKSGGSGALKTNQTFTVTPGEKIQIVVGPGGIAGITNGNGGNGGNSSIKGVAAQGGQGGIAPTETSSGTNGTSYGNGGQGGSAGTTGQDGWVTLKYYGPKTSENINKPGKAGGNGGIVTQKFAVTPGEEVEITVGKGGVAGVKNRNGQDGGDTIIKGVAAQGGQGGIAPTETSSGANGLSYGNGALGGSAGRAGSNGYATINYTVNTYEYTLTATSTNDTSATDNAAPVINKLYLDGILGNKEEYKIVIEDEDRGTKYDHYIIGRNYRYSPTVVRESNAVTTTVITYIKTVAKNEKAYSWIIDKKSNTDPDKVIGYDNENNEKIIFPKTIESSYVNNGYWLHVRTIDNAENWSETKHLELNAAIIELKSHYAEQADSRGYGPNYVPLSWTNSDTSNKYFYRLYENSELIPEWRQVSTKYGESLKVLNIYPTGSAYGASTTETSVTFKSEIDGKTYTLPKSASLKMWMEAKNSESPKGYGKGLIKVDPVSIDDFNNNPDTYLKDSNGQYKYDVLMFGTWDDNAGNDLNEKSSNATQSFINAGRGVLFGHDTVLDTGDDVDHDKNSSSHDYFNDFCSKLNITTSVDIPWIGSTTVNVVKKGFLTRYPYNIETGNLTIPYSHTTGQHAYGDIWLRYVPPYGRYYGSNTDTLHEIGPETGDDANNNFYVTTWNNISMIQTGHSNCEATSDEQRIIANVLWYLGQVTTDNSANAHTAEDLANPEIVDIQISDNKKEDKWEIDIKGIDNGTVYDHYISGTKQNSQGTYYSNTVNTEVKTGIKEFVYTINDSETDYTGKEYIVNAVNKENCKIDISKTYKGKYLHIKPIDIAGNVGEVVTIYLEGARTIPREERNETEELYCIEEDVLIPAKYDGTQLDATVEVAGKRELVSWPINLTKLFDIYIEDGASLKNPYTRNGRDQDVVDKTNSLGRYLLESKPKATLEEEYILSHYADNNIENSESQKALYELLAERNNSITQGTHRNKIYYEAKEYAKFRETLKQKGGFFTKQIKHEIVAGYNLSKKQYIIGPFEVNYLRNFSNITVNNETYKIEFSGIGDTKGTTITNRNGIHIYDQNGKEIPQNTWSLEYDNKTQKEKTRSETYTEYEMPLPNEEFYIKINRAGNENVTKISKIVINYYEMYAEAQYSILDGNYNTIRWNGRNSENLCEGGRNGELCVHGKKLPHIIGHKYFINSNVVTANLHSQKLLEIESANREYKVHKHTIDITTDVGPEIKLVMDFAGNIWDDQSEIISNGYKEIEENGIKGVEVFLIDNSTKEQVNYTVTDENGNYIFKDTKAGKYNIKYTYDGQTFVTTKSFVAGTVADYKENANEEIYADISIADETESARNNLNSKFAIIKNANSNNANEGEALAVDAMENDLTKTTGESNKFEYKVSGTTSKVITRNEQTNISLEPFKIAIDTATKGILFPANGNIFVNGNEYIILKDNKIINVGLSEREKTYQNLKLDVYQTIFTMKGNRQSFLHSGKDIRNINSNNVVNEYIQYVNPDDYNFRLSQYKDKVSAEDYQKILTIFDNKNENEPLLDAEVEYMIIIRNKGENDAAYIRELVDYYDKSLEYKKSWILIRKDDETEDNYQGERKNLDWSKTSKYGDVNKYSDKFDKIYADLTDYGLVKGEYAEIHILFDVKKNANGIILDGEEGKKNAAEINVYSNRNKTTGKIAGLIDLNSKPGDLNPTENVEVYEDDEDKAPDYKLKLGYGDGFNGEGNGLDGDNDGANTPRTDEYGNPIGYGNTIEGNVWEDLRRDPNRPTLTLANNQVIGDAIKQSTEPVIDDIRVNLIEIIEGKGLKVEVPLRQTRTKNVLLLTDRSRDNGAYRFSHLTGGKYKLMFTYGEAEQLQKDLKYNGQDYQGISTAQIYEREGLKGNFEDTEIMIVIDNSGSMTGTKMEQVKQAAEILTQNLQSKLPGIKIGVANFSENANLIGSVNSNSNNYINGVKNLTAGGETSIGRGIRAGLSGYTTNGKTRLMVLLTDGQETVETEEAVIMQIEALREGKIELTTLLTGKSENIFGTEASPRYGKVYEIEDNSSIIDTVTNELYEEIKKQSEIEEDRSLGRDIEEDRRKQIDEYSELNYTKATVLDIEAIENIEDSNKKTERINNLAETTKMRTETSMVEFRANNIGPDKIHEVNQALLERPTAKLQLVQDISGIKVTLSDGRVIIDTAKGLSKNVMGLDVPDPKAPISIFMDEEIMQGATIEVTYKIALENVGEIDKLSNYFEDGSDATIPTTAKVIYAYLNQNIVYRADAQTEDSAEWTVITLNTNKEKEQINSELSPDTIKDIKTANNTSAVANGIKMLLRTNGLKEKALYPANSLEVLKGNGEYLSDVSTDLILSRLISPEDEDSTNLTYDCAMEVTVRGNDAGRRVANAIPGNHRIGTEAIVSVDSEETSGRRIIITKPWGENRNNTYLLVALGIASVLALGIVLTKKKR